MDFRNDEDEDVIEVNEEELREMFPNIRDPDPFSIHRPDSEDFPWEPFFPEFAFSAMTKKIVGTFASNQIFMTSWYRIV